MSRYIEADWLLCKIYDLVNAINDEAPTIEPKYGEWIPCSERLPKADEYVLLWAKGKGFTCVLTKGEHVIYWATKNIAKAWMPLPEPYERSE